MTTNTTAPHVVVAGAGPAGLAAANFLCRYGVNVTVVERAPAGVRNPARPSVVIGREGWDVLERLGGKAFLEDELNVVNERQILASLSRIDTALAEEAERIGATIRRGVSIEGVVEHESGMSVSVTVHDAATGEDEVLGADWYVDATGGRSPLGADPRFTKSVVDGPFHLRDSPERLYAMVRVPADPERGVGWTGENGSFAINDRTDGVLSAYVAVVDDGAVPDSTTLLRWLEIDVPDEVDEIRTLLARQSIAPSAATGRIVCVGDSVGSMIPVEQSGVVLAMTDGERAAETIVKAQRATSAEAAAKLISDYDEITVAMHKAFIR